MADQPVEQTQHVEQTPSRALRLGVAGPVGTGKSSLIALLCRNLAGEFSLGVITNDIYTDEDARFLRSAGVLPAERIRAVETGACPHTAIRDDITRTCSRWRTSNGTSRRWTSSWSRPAVTT